jgi:putative ABC transport system permease protein
MKNWPWSNRHRRRREDELDEEIQAHLRMAAEERAGQGDSVEQARAAATREFGNVALVKEVTRDMWGYHWLETLLQDIRYGLRQLRRSPGFTAVAVLTLALGIGANTAIFSLINAVMLRALPVEKPEELFQVKKYDPTWISVEAGAFTNPLWEQLRDQQDIFSGIFAWGTRQFNLARGGAVQPAEGIWVSGGFFETLGLRPAAGRLISPSDDRRGCPPVAVLSDGFWKDHFGAAPSAVGSALSLDNQRFEVIGVAPPGFYGMFVGDKFDVAVLDGAQSSLDDRSSWWLFAAGRVKQGITRAQLSARLKLLSPGIFSAALPQDWSPEEQRKFVDGFLEGVPAGAGLSYLRLPFSEPLDILMAVAGLVLLIACANIASLMLARSAARQKEFSLRRALGASRLRVIRQLLTECVLVSSIGALTGLLFARWASALLVRYISTRNEPVFLTLPVDSRVLGFTAAIALFTAILFGVIPAWRTTRGSLASEIKGGGEMALRGNFRSSRWIVASQLALSLVLLVAAGLLLRSFEKLSTLDIGFDRNNVLLVSVDLNSKMPPERRLALYEDVERRLRAIPGMVAAGRSSETPISGRRTEDAIRTDWSGGLRGDDTHAFFNYVSPGFFDALRMRLVAGRDFDNGDSRNAPRVVIVNQALARRFFPHLNPVGRTLRVDDVSGKPGPPIEVVGLIRDSKYRSVREADPPTAFFPAPQAREDASTYELRTSVPPMAIASQVQAAVGEVNKEISLDFHTLAEQVNDSLAPERLLALLSVFFGGLALLLAMVGLYGTLSYLVGRRQTEFGVRMALGARRGSVLRLVLRDVGVVLAIGLMAGTGISLVIVRLLQKMLFGLGPHDPMTIAAAVVTLTAAALVAAYLPARRATKVDPMVALRYE